MDITESLTIDTVAMANILSYVALDIPIETVDTWSQTERQAVCEWAGAMLFDAPLPPVPAVIREAVYGKSL